MRASENSKFRTRFGIGFMFVLVTVSAVLIAVYPHLSKASSGTLPVDWKDAYYQSYYQYEMEYHDRDRQVTHSEMNQAIDVEYDSVRVVAQKDMFTWHSVNRKIGQKLLDLAKSITHEKRTLIEGEQFVFPDEFEMHFVRNNRLVLSCLLYTSPSPRDATLSRMPSSA